MYVCVRAGMCRLVLPTEKDAHKEAKCLVENIIKLTKKGSSSGAPGSDSGNARLDLNDRKTMVRKAAIGIAELEKP